MDKLDRYGIATDLLQAGVCREDIVLAFHPPRLRNLQSHEVRARSLQQINLLTINKQIALPASTNSGK
jgi:hypothetical protein